jgi:ABC-type branched-subunit amino acid transport system permease subunit
MGAIVIGACVAAVVGALLAIPMMRLGGIFLSLATLAFAFFFDQVVLQLGWVGGGTKLIVVPRPLLGSIDFSKGDKAFLVLALVILTLVSIAVIWVRGGTTGRTLDAMRGSEVAAAAIGINHRRARIVAFALSAAIAGLGGGLMITYTHLGTASNIDSVFVPELGLAWIVLVVTLGSRTVEGAINAAVGFVFFQAVVLPTWIPFAANHVQPWYHMSSLPPALQPILFGLGALTYAKHPEGILEFQKRRSYARIQRIIDRFGRSGKIDSAAPDEPDGTRVVATAGGGS